jgi:hypothetical protein
MEEQTQPTTPPAPSVPPSPGTPQDQPGQGPDTAEDPREPQPEVQPGVPLNEGEGGEGEKYDGGDIPSVADSGFVGEQSDVGGSDAVNDTQLDEE